MIQQKEKGRARKDKEKKLKKEKNKKKENRYVPRRSLSPLEKRGAKGIWIRGGEEVGKEKREKTKSNYPDSRSQKPWCAHHISKLGWNGGRRGTSGMTEGTRRGTHPKSHKEKGQNLKRVGG